MTGSDLVCGALGDQYNLRAAPDGAGGVFVVWEDFRRTGSLFDRSHVDLYAQRIAPEGKSAPGWPLDGLPECMAPGDRTAVSVMPDGLGGLFLCWTDGRSFASLGTDVYGLRITGQGNVAEGWVTDGTPICTAPGHQTLQVLPDLASDAAGGFIVAWLDARTAPPGEVYLEDYVDIYAQRLTASGSIAPGWPVNGLPICTAPDLQQDHRVTSDGAGGAIVVWSDYRDRFVTASDLYAQRVLASGQIALGWPANGVALRKAPGFELGSAVVPDGTGGALVAFEGNEIELYAQHVTGSGAIAPGWDPNGVRLSEFRSQENPAAVSDGKGGMIVAWEGYRGTASGYDVYAQRVGGDYPTPTLVSLVSAAAEPGRVVLKWSGPTNLSAAMVYRRDTSSGWAPLGAPREAGSDLLMFEDRTVAEGRYAYRLGYASGAGEVFTAEVWVTVPGGYELTLVGFSPNPALREPMVSFALAHRAPARLEIFDVSGRVVVAHEVGSLGPGSHRFTIGHGGGLTPGVYWLRLTQQGKSLTAKGLVAR